MEIVKIGHSWPERPGFKINRPNGISEYLVLHFWESFEITLNNRKFMTEPHACIIYKATTPQFFGCENSSMQDWFRIIGNVEETMEKYGLQFDTLYYPENYAFITDLVRRMEVELSNKKEYYKEICNLYVNEFFMFFSREVYDRQSKDNINLETKKQLKRLRQKLQLEYYKKWEIEDMANYINFSPSYLHATYKRFFGISPMHDLISIRIERAKTLLNDSKHTVNEIAVCLGYMNPSYFIRQFTKNVGISPKKYRQRNHLDNRLEGRFPASVIDSGNNGYTKSSERGKRNG